MQEYSKLYKYVITMMKSEKSPTLILPQGRNSPLDGETQRGDEQKKTILCYLPLCYKLRNISKLSAVLLLSLMLTVSCTHEDNHHNNQNNFNDNRTKVINNVSFNTEKGDMLFKLADTLQGKFSFAGNTAPDSIILFVDGRKSGKINFSDGKFPFYTGTQKLGNHTLMFFSYFGKDKEVDTYRYTLLNNASPKIITWKVVKTFPHNVKSYTQGLFFKDGFLFEGTGQWGQSSLQKIDLAKNEVIKTYSLPHDIFGEGIVAYKNKIIELTWQSHEAFEYDAETFKLINRFTYDTEGWGITNYGDSLLMSDGTNLLYILDPASFTVIDKIQVFDDKGPVRNLNELENINGQIFANVYQTDDIVIIDPKTGAVTHKINLKGLLPDDERTPQTDVLNGIAWDNDRKIFLVTGKNWPHMYQLELSGITLE